MNISSLLTRPKSKPCKAKEAVEVDFVKEFDSIMPFIQNLFVLKNSNDDESNEKLFKSLNELYSCLKRLVNNDYFCILYTDHIVSLNVLILIT